MQYTITGIRESVMGRGIVPFCLTLEAESPEEALEKCRRAYGSYDVMSGRAVLIPAELGEVQITLSQIEPVQAVTPEEQAIAEPLAATTEPAEDSATTTATADTQEESPSDGING